MSAQHPTSTANGAGNYAADPHFAESQGEGSDSSAYGAGHHHSKGDHDVEKSGNVSIQDMKAQETTANQQDVFGGAEGEDSVNFKSLEW